MSLILEALKYKPIGLFRMDDTSPLQDYSPYNRVATYSGTPARHPALVHGATYAPLLSSTSIAEFECPIFVQGRESDAFSLAVSFRQSSTGTQQKILSHNGAYDGLTINGTVVSFSTSYLTTGEAKCSYDLQTKKAADVVGVHTYNKNVLFVNGELVAEANITLAQRADQYITTDGSLYSGPSVSGGTIAVNAVMYFDYALDTASVKKLHEESRRIPSSKDVAPMFGGERISMSRDASDIFAMQTWRTSEDWNSAQLSGVAVRNENLVPQFSSGVSMSGKWYDNFPLSSAGTTSIYGVNLDWEGEGVTVDVSLDAVTWTSVTKGVNVSIVPPGFNPTDKELLIRISFSGGITNDTSYMKSLTAIGIRTAVSPTWSGRVLTFSNAFQQREEEAISMDANWGVKINNGGTVTISPDTNAQTVDARTIELWIRAEDSSAGVNVTGTYYQNGVSSTSTLPVGIWSLFHIVAAANVDTDIIISGAAQVGQVAVYSTALDSTQIAEISASYAGSNTLFVGDNSPVAISESTTSAQMYAHNWSILSSG